MQFKLVNCTFTDFPPSSHKQQKTLVFAQWVACILLVLLLCRRSFPCFQRTCRCRRKLLQHVSFVAHCQSPPDPKDGKVEFKGDAKHSCATLKFCKNKVKIARGQGAQAPPAACGRLNWESPPSRPVNGWLTIPLLLLPDIPLLRWIRICCEFSGLTRRAPGLTSEGDKTGGRETIANRAPAHRTTS
eukprot:765683-Hanusia_phi.AAC.3